MLKQKVIEAALIEAARLSGQEQLILLTSIRATLAARERHRQQMNVAHINGNISKPVH